MIRQVGYLLLFLLTSVVGASTMTGADTDESVRARIASRFPGVSAEDVKPSPVQGLYEIAVGPIILYASSDGRYLVKGEIYDLETDRNLTESRAAEARLESLAELGEDDVIIFGDDDAEHTVTVFTDVSCAYCRRLHNRIDEYVDRGIQVRYAAYPRNGLATETWQVMEDVWCAPDRRKALTLAKQDREFETSACGTEQVMEQWQLGRMLGVRGTPAIFTETGEMIPGYLPPDELLKRLEALQAQ